LGGYAGQVVLAKDYLRALRVRRVAAARLDRLLSGVDAIAAPSLPTVAWPLDTPFDKVYPTYPGGTNISGAANLCGVPGLFLMNGLGEAGLPTSLQLTGRALGEATLLEIGIQYQQRTTFHRLRPNGL
jgi:aspartyl-tRNA(Asn)/glutamyl-tRNA(Gln) amidotransferase subunit A